MVAVLRRIFRRALVLFNPSSTERLYIRSSTEGGDFDHPSKKALHFNKIKSNLLFEYENGKKLFYESIQSRQTTLCDACRAQKHCSHTLEALLECLIYFSTLLACFTSARYFRLIWNIPGSFDITHELFH